MSFFSRYSRRASPIKAHIRKQSRKQNLFGHRIGLGFEHLERRQMLSFSNVLVNNPTEDPGSLYPEYSTQSETSTLAYGNTQLVAFNDSGSEYSSPNHNQLTGYAISTNGGQTFTDEGTLPASSLGDAGDPVLARDNVNGNIYFSTLVPNPSAITLNVLDFYKSTNGGSIFSQPVNSAPGFATGEQLDKDWLIVDNASGTGQGYIYQTFTDFNSTGVDRGIYLTRSTDGGNTWGPNGGTLIASGAAVGPNVVVGSDHSVHIFWLDHNQGYWQILTRKSTDNGTTFGSAVTQGNRITL